MKWTLRIKSEKIQRHRRLRYDLRKRELTGLIYFILSRLNSNSLSQRENENENEWENCTKRDGYRSLDLWAFFWAQVLNEKLVMLSVGYTFAFDPNYWDFLGQHFGPPSDVEEIILIFLISSILRNPILKLKNHREITQILTFEEMTSEMP